MAWSAFHITLNPGQTTEIGFTWNDDHGVQFASAREFTGSTRNNRLRVNNHSIRRRTDNNLTYSVSVTNVGSQVASFELVGDRV